MRLRGKISFAQIQGPREDQEDYIVHLPFISRTNGYGHLLGILDGHAGKEVAEYCADQIPILFDVDLKDVGVALEQLTEQLDARTCLADEGSTLSLACVNESRGFVTTAVIGDSPIIVVNKLGETWLSEEHNVRTNLREREAAVRRGAVYKDGYICHSPGGDKIQMSRALGDRVLRNILDRTPTINTHYLGAHSLVVVCSDGLFDPDHERPRESMAQSIVTLAQNGSSASGILRFRESRGLEDNTSIIMWKPKSWWEWF